MNRITALLTVARPVILVGAALAALSLSSCSWQEVVNGTTRTHFVVLDTDTASFDAVSGDTIDVIFTRPDVVWDAAGNYERCMDMGGDDYTFSPVTGLYVCEGVDF